MHTESLRKSDWQLIPLDSITVDEQKDPISEVAQRIFSTNYTDLVKMTEAYSNQLSELEKQKELLERSWAVCCFSTSTNYFCISTTEGLVLGVSGMVTVICGGLSQNFVAVSIGVGVVGSMWLPFLCNSSFCLQRLPCVKSTLDQYQFISNALPKVQKEKNTAMALLKVAHLFAVFCDKWSSFEKTPTHDKTIELFKVVDKIVNSKQMKKLADSLIINLVPLYLMEKVTKILPESELATEWENLKTAPAKWGVKEIKPWKIVDFPSPDSSHYAPFFQKGRLNCR